MDEIWRIKVNVVFKAIDQNVRQWFSLSEMELRRLYDMILLLLDREK